MNKRKITLLLGLFCTYLLSTAATRTYDMSQFGIIANSTEDMAPLMDKALQTIRQENSKGNKIVLRFTDGTYQFHPDKASTRTYYISNHDQDNPKKVGLCLEDFNNLTIEGNGAQFTFHGRMLPISLIRSKNCTLKDFSIDFTHPHIAQIQIVANSAEQGITFRVAPWVNYQITADSLFEHSGEGWTLRPSWGIAFEEKTKHVVYNTSDIGFNLKGVTETAPRVLHAPNWKDKRLVPGTVVAMRGWGRPTPGLFLSHSTNTKIQRVKVHYAEGMGLLAQLCDHITMDGFGVCLKGDNDPRYFTTQADATHFSGCKGKITSVNGLYEGMMDDAINVHGTYLKITKRIDDRTIVGRYMHGQSWGFTWGYAGDKVQFVKSSTMELIGGEAQIVSITPHDQKDEHGAREFLIRFNTPLDAAINEKEGFGVENLTWTPEVYFAGNTIRNNRARGSLFSTPKKTIVENNLFDHTSGTGILLCGDCNGWYETGACREVIIRNNTFINALTSQFQFTNAIISIYPEIPNLKEQVKYFHGGKKGSIRIENNTFETFDMPILYAKSVNGLTFKNNIIKTNTDYKPYHWNKQRFLFERVINADIQE